MAKGSSFERQICKTLSLWWTNGERDDVFWRTAGSGAMATSRRKRGSTTLLQHGDIQAVDPIGKPLTDLMTLELKRGYNQCTLSDMFDSPRSKGKQRFAKFIEQAQRSAEAAGTPFWAVIHKRDQKRITITLPAKFDTFGLRRAIVWIAILTDEEKFIQFDFEEFLNALDPGDIQR
jgi:hypothetical protein